MRCEVVELRGDPAAFAAALRALVPAAEAVTTQVAEIVDAVRTRGDEALREYTRALDTAGIEPPPLKVQTAELDSALAALDEPVKTGLEAAIANVRRVAGTGRAPDQAVEFQTHTVTVREAPVASAAVYVPGGRAPYPSTVVMGVVTARAAGVAHVAVASPPTADADINSAILAASHLAGADAVYRMGGAQAIAALAYGTESVQPVDVIVGPGNLYVQEAKRHVSAQVGIDGFAGPSDLVVIAGDDAPSKLVSLDLAAQAEHGEGTLVVAISTSLSLLEEVGTSLERAAETRAIARLVHAPDAARALALAQALAPEHLQLVGTEVEPLAQRVTTAGCVFVGARAGTAFGDYVVGSNHVLPTAGSARFASALSPATFRRRFYEVTITAAGPLAAAAAPLARAEGFDVHARSMEARIGHNGQQT